MATSGILTKVFSDPQKREQWEQYALMQGENQTEFNEMDIGTVPSKTGPQPSDTVVSSPILRTDELREVGSGKMTNIKIKKPLFSSAENLLKTRRFDGEKRSGSEQEAERGNVIVPVGGNFLALSEDDIQQGLQDTANMSKFNLISEILRLLNGNVSKWMDVGVFYSLAAGYDYHHFANAAVANGVSAGSKPVGDDSMGILAPPTEHPNMYVWHDGSLEHVPFNTTQSTFSDSIDTAVSQVTSNDTPSLKWIRAVNNVAWMRDMIASNMRPDNNMGVQEFNYYMFYVPGRVRELLTSSSDFMKVYSRSYQGQVQANPLLRTDDLMYDKLIIRKSKWLEEDLFNMSKSYNATGGSNGNSTNMSVKKTGSIDWTEIAPGTRSVVTGSPLEGDVNDTSQIGRCFLVGANGVIRGPGADFGIMTPDDTDYERLDGAGIYKGYGQIRVDSYSQDLSYDTTIQSACFPVFMGSK